MNKDFVAWKTTSKRIEDLQAGIEHLISQTDTGAILALCCSSNSYPSSELHSVLTSCQISIFGGYVPGIIFNEELHEQGVLLIAFKGPIDIYLYRGLSKDTIDLERLISNSSVPIDEHRNLICFTDGMSELTEKFIHRLYEHMGSDIRIIGGGTGHHQLKSIDCIFSNFGAMPDSAVIAGMPHAFNTQIATGWHIIDGPYLASRAQDNRLHSINYNNAFKAYKERVESASGQILEVNHFYDLASHYPLGIQSLTGDLKIRDPIFTDQSSITCVGDIHQNSMIYILTGNPHSLVKAVEEAARGLKPVEIASPFWLSFHCLSRKLFLEENFDQECKAISTEMGTSHCHYGILTLGEIANNQSGRFSWLNKSMVIGSF